MLNPYHQPVFDFSQASIYKFIILHPAILRHPKALYPALVH